MTACSATKPNSQINNGSRNLGVPEADYAAEDTDRGAREEASGQTPGRGRAQGPVEG